jgi:UDP-N-acetylmuramate--alanine ligase
MKIHFIGIGGIGISALARKYLAEGKTVSGSDRSESPITKELSTLGVEIKIGHAAANIPADCDLIIYTIAIEPDNPELLEAKQRGIKLLTYPQALGLLSAEKYTIAISGTHGKTTTTAMIAKIMIDAGLDPTVIVGSLMKENGYLTSVTNFIAGKSKYLVVEACEYRRSFLNLSPKILVITNIDNDHLDYYQDLDDIKSAFAEFAAKLPADGVLITEKEYSQITRPIKLQIPGEHNQKNAQAALAVAQALRIEPIAARRSLAEFAGTWRRFEFKGKTKEGALVYDDYAHHPTEIKATLAGAREMFPERRIIVIFQPHLYSRTKLLSADFAAAFCNADEVILLPIYAAREPFDSTVSSEMLAEAITKQGTKAITLPDFISVQNYLSTLTPTEALSERELVIIMGAGDIFELAPTLVIIKK